MLKRDVQSLRFCSKEEQLFVIVQSVFDSTWLQQHSLFYFNLIRPTTKSKVKDSLVYCWGVDNSISFKSKWRLCSLALIYTYSSLTHKKSWQSPPGLTHHSCSLSLFFVITFFIFLYVLKADIDPQLGQVIGTVFSKYLQRLYVGHQVYGNIIRGSFCWARMKDYLFWYKARCQVIRFFILIFSLVSHKKCNFLCLMHFNYMFKMNESMNISVPNLLNVTDTFL